MAPSSRKIRLGPNPKEAGAKIKYPRMSFQGRIRKQGSILSSQNAYVKCSSLLIVMPFIPIARRFKFLFTDIIDLLMCAKDRTGRS